MARGRVAVLLAAAFVLTTACSRGDGVQTVDGSMSFVLAGGTESLGQPLSSRRSPLDVRTNTSALLAGEQYIATPNQAKVTFTSVAFRRNGQTVHTSTFDQCVVTYDRTIASGSVLLDCPFDAPVGEVTELALYFDKDLEILVSDPSLPVYTDPGTPTGFTTVAPSGGADFVPYTVTIGTGTERATPIVFATPLTIEAGSTPKLYATMDMIHTVQMTVDSTGTTFTAGGGNDPVALFAGLTPGRSLYFSGASSVAAYKVQGVASLRIFTDDQGTPLFSMMGLEHCGTDGPKGAWATAPAGAHVGGWLGKDASGVFAWALPADNNYSQYAAYFTMQDQDVVGQKTTLHCKATTSPPPPADGKTYASGAPPMSAPDTSTELTLIGH